MRGMWRKLTALSCFTLAVEEQFGLFIFSLFFIDVVLRWRGFGIFFLLETLFGSFFLHEVELTSGCARAIATRS